MNPLLFDNLRDFVKRYYADKDSLEDLDHVQRLLSEARALAADEPYDEDQLIFGAYFHGLIFTDEAEIRNFLFSLGLDRELVIRIMKVAWESGKDAVPETVEGALLHDAHLIEGGKEFQVAKWLMGAVSNGHTLPQIVAFLGDRLAGKYKCHTPPGRETHAEIEAYRQNFVRALKIALAGGNAVVEGFPGAAKKVVGPQAGTSMEKDA